MKLTFPLFLCAFAILSTQGYAQQKIITISGTGIGGFNGDGIAAAGAELNAPNGLALDAAGNVYVQDYLNNRIRKISTTGYITTIAGNGVMGNGGDGSIGTSATIGPTGVAVDNGGNVYISDESYGVIRKVNTLGIISRFAGNGTQGNDGDNGPATAAMLNGVGGMAFDTAGNFYVADRKSNVIRKVAKTTNIITTVAGDGTSAFSGDGFPATSVGLDSPFAVATDRRGNLYFSDLGSDRVRKVDANGMLTTVAGSGVKGFSGDLGAATAAKLNRPAGIAVDSIGNLYIADADNDVIRKVDTFGVITTVAGNHTPGFGGDLGDPVGANLHTPFGVAIDRYGSLYIADANNQRIRKTFYTTAVIDVANNTGIAIFPNPVTNNLLVSGISKTDNICIYDLAGRQVVNVVNNTSSGSQLVPVSSIATGVYMLQVSDLNGYRKFVAKIVKE